MPWDRPPTKEFIKVQADANTEMRKIALKVLGNLAATTPVDTGRAKGNWQTALNSKPVGTLEQHDKAGAVMYALGKRVVDGAALGDSIWISNNLPYIQRLNDGWSQQAPANFVQLAITKAIR